jgi:penicillin amidase
MQWFPVIPLDQNTQRPYDTGPYHLDAPVPLDSAAPSAAIAPAGGTHDVGDAETSAASDLLARMAALPSDAFGDAIGGGTALGGNSNNWAVDGTKTASGMPLMAGDPHLHQTLPAIWYQVQYDSPSFHAAGVTIPGLPGVIIGHNQHISWSLTNTQNAATFYYQERTDAAHPGQYYWQGGWHPLQTISYSIPVKHRAPVSFAVKLSVHGPLMTQNGETLAVWWAGAQPSPDIGALVGVNQAGNFQQFRDALRGWHSPSQNFVYADDQGNIGLISAGYYPQVASGQPWLPLPGDGSADVVGTIPFDDIPQVYDPPSHIVWSANQREVGADYPYYIGTSLEFFDPGYRADQIEQTLSSGSNFTAADMQRLQNNTHDFLSGLILPHLASALAGQSLAPREQQAAALLAQWDGNMTVDSPAATIWMRFWTQYMYETFHPWWVANQMPIKQDPSLDLSPKQTGSLSGVLGEDLVAWTAIDPANAAFSLPDGTPRTAPDVMRTAFSNAVAALATQLGPDPATWTWGRVHTREFDSLVQIASLNYGPRPASGGPWTVDAATSNEFDATHGPSWRFVMDWSTGQSWGVYPGGQSENPLSPWYENQIAAWWNGSYYPMLDGDQARAAAGTTTWIIQP